jgi:predicted alpha/beta-hydrolase family hydrolase
MIMETETLKVEISEHEAVTALLYPAPKRGRARITLVLGHGAGANQLSLFMRLFASGLAARGFDLMTFNFLYAEKGRHMPDPKAKLEACYRAVIAAAVGHRKLRGNRLAIGGKSMGGRIASQVATAELTFLDGRDIPLAGLVLLGYPLHPPGNPEKIRDEHLKDIRVPMLFCQGARDTFGTRDEIRAVIKRLRLEATLYPIEGGDHSFKVPKSLGVPQEQVYGDVMAEIARWLVELCAP